MSAAVAPASSTSSEGNTFITRGGRICPLCGKPGTKVCAGCSKVGYCSKEHQRDDWKEHKKVCAQKHKLLQPSSSPSSSSLPTPKEEISVTWQDQQSINLFSRLNTRHSVLVDQLKALQKTTANIADAADTLETLIDDDCTMIKVGEVFVRVSNEEGEEWVKREKEREEARRDKIEKEKLEIEKKMAELKTILYGKFGKAINLENAEQTIND